MLFFVKKPPWRKPRRLISLPGHKPGKFTYQGCGGKRVMVHVLFAGGRRSWSTPKIDQSLTMGNSPDILWEGLSGTKYGYWISPIDSSWKQAPGNYIFAKETSPGSNRWLPVYIGQSEDLADRFSHHEKADCAIRNGATHIHNHTSSPDVAVRCAEEADLIKKWQPVCNDQLKAA